MSSKYQIGDIVRLKSGGPEMAVKILPTQVGNSYTCQWFAGKKLEQGNFAEPTLEAVVPEKK
jgi:uncharacterized protein YodC (DUF2158 family)